MALSEQTVAIAVIGVTGSGKSTFINLASGSNLPVRESLGSCTTELESSTFSLDGRTVTLIDTPGFNDTTPSVLHVLKSISDYYSQLYSQGIKLAGVIYMHCVTEDHMGGPSRHNFLTFSKFCGDTTLRDVVIVANKCPGKAHNDGDGREKESAHGDECFMNAVDKGARMLRHDGSQASAHAILRQFIRREPTTPPVKGESSNRRPDLVRTTSGADNVRTLTDQVEHHTKVFEELCKGIDAATLAKDEEKRKMLQEEAKSSLEKIERIRYDLEQLVTNFAAENSRLEDENQRYKDAFSAQKAEAELRAQLLEDENRRYKDTLSAQKVEAEFQTWLLEDEDRHHKDVLATQMAEAELRTRLLEDENRRYKDAFSEQRTEAELRTRLLEEERRARELAETERRRAEVRLAEERASWERGKMDKERFGVHPKRKYGKLFTCGAVIFALVCASRFVLDGSTPLL